MNVTAYQEKEKNKETKTSKRKAGEKRKRKQETDFKKAVRCPAAIVQGQHSDKMKGSGWGNWDPREGQQPFRPNPIGVRDRTTTLRQLLIFVVCTVYKASKIELYESTATSTWWCGPQPSLDWVEMAVGLPEVLSCRRHSPHTNHFFCRAFP